jgi:uncharacterized membrane protein
VRRTFELSERIVYRIPVIRSVYGATRDFLQFLVHSRDPGFHEVVMVDIGDTGMQVLGFITRPDTSGLPQEAVRDEDSVLVYLPLSYQIGGYTVLLPRSALRPVGYVHAHSHGIRPDRRRLRPAWRALAPRPAGKRLVTDLDQ